MNEQRIQNLIDIYYNLPHKPHSASKGTNTGCNDFDLSGSEHKSLVMYAIEALGTHEVRTQRLNKASLERHVPNVTDPKMVNRLKLLGAYVSQIDMNINGELYQFQGISTSKRDSLSMAYVVAMSCVKRLVIA